VTVATFRFVFGGLAVADHDAALGWYERLFGRAPDLVPKEGDAAWQLTDTAWVYVVADAQRAGRGLVTVLVDDLDALAGSLAERGLELGPIETVPGAVRRARITDPEGNRITFGEAPAPAGAIPESDRRA
jgi:predicted enzyme related to lactoylglutathione lyase